MLLDAEVSEARNLELRIACLGVSAQSREQYPSHKSHLIFRLWLCLVDPIRERCC